MIGIESTRDYSGVVYPPFSKIRRGDEIVYYAIRDCVILGVFRVTSDQQRFEDPKWGPVYAYRIAPIYLPPIGSALDFRQVVKNFKLDLIPSANKWPAYLRGHACRPLSDHDYELMKKRLIEGPGLVPLPMVKQV